MNKPKPAKPDPKDAKTKQPEKSKRPEARSRPTSRPTSDDDRKATSKAPPKGPVSLKVPPIIKRSREAEAPESSGYKGTARPTPAQTYKGTGRPTSSKTPNLPASGSRPRGRPSRPSPGYETDEEEDYPEDCYSGDESSDMEAGVYDIDEEEELALRTARAEDAAEKAREDEMRRQKLERKRALIGRR